MIDRPGQPPRTSGARISTSGTSLRLASGSAEARPLEAAGTEGRVVRKPVMATADVRFQDETSASAPSLPNGLPRRGMSTVAALSSVLVHENHRGAESWSQTYRFGEPVRDLAPIVARATTGTTVTFLAELAGPTELTDEDVLAFAHVRIDRR